MGAVREKKIVPIERRKTQKRSEQEPSRTSRCTAVEAFPRSLYSSLPSILFTQSISIFNSYAIDRLCFVNYNSTTRIHPQLTIKNSVTELIFSTLVFA